jgi:choline-sulfatase
MSAPNVIVIMTDELRRDALGCYGNKIVQTPHIDALAARGLRYDAAYTPCPICVPARAAIATGSYVHETQCWSNAQPYAGQIPSWHHQMRAAGRDMPSIGKLHFRSTKDDNGFSEEIEPLHINNGQGWVHGLLRERDDLFDASGFATHIGPGDDSYSRYDQKVCAATIDWLNTRATSTKDTPFGLYVSFLRPHYPLTCPPEFYARYDPAKMPLPRKRTPTDGTDHPVLQHMARACDYDAAFDDDMRRMAVASYYGLCSFVDDMVGQIMATLRATGLDQTTTVIFTSDHGECLGDRNFWTKMVMYEESAAVPLIISGPSITSGTRSDPVSLIDLAPTVLDLSAVPRSDSISKHARCLLAPPDAERAVLSEYHDYGAPTGIFMLRFKHWKLVAYPGYPSQLFDLKTDPGESNDLAPDPTFADTLKMLTTRLEAITDPATTNAMALKDQARRIKELGGRDAIRAMQNYDHTPVTA